MGAAKSILAPFQAQLQAQIQAQTGEAKSETITDASSAPTKNTRLPVVDVVGTASDEQKQQWWNVWDEAWKAKLDDQYHYSFSESVKQEQLETQSQGSILGISGRGIEYFFQFLDTNGGHRFRKEVWERLGTDIAPIYDADNDRLRSLHDLDVDVGMEWLVFGLIKKVTALHGVKFLDLFMGLCHKDVPCVGAATDFHSYTWQETVGETYQAVSQHLTLMEHSARPHYFWWDVFCQNQHDAGDVAQTFSSTIDQVDTLAFSTPNFARPRALGRVWCQFELANAAMKGKRIMILPGAGGSNSGLEQWCASSDDPMKSWVPVSQASAKYEADKTMLLNLVDSTVEGGQEGLNALVRREYVSKALGYRLWYAAQWERGNDGFQGRVEAMLKAGADPNFTNGYNTAIDQLSHYDDPAVAVIRAAGGKTNQELLATL